VEEFSKLRSSLLPKSLLERSLMVENTTCGETYLETLRPRRSPTFGATNKEMMITIRPTTEYRIEFVAGLTLSSLPPERMSITPHHTMKKTESIPAISTMSAIETRITSSSSYTWPPIRESELEEMACAVDMSEKSKNISERMR